MILITLFRTFTAYVEDKFTACRTKRNESAQPNTMIRVFLITIKPRKVMRGRMKVVKRPNYDTQLCYIIFIKCHMCNVYDRPSRCPRLYSSISINAKVKNKKRNTPRVLRGKSTWNFMEKRRVLGRSNTSLSLIL